MHSCAVLRLRQHNCVYRMFCAVYFIFMLPLTGKLNKQSQFNSAVPLIIWPFWSWTNNCPGRITNNLIWSPIAFITPDRCCWWLIICLVRLEKQGITLWSLGLKNWNLSKKIRNLIKLFRLPRQPNLSCGKQPCNQAFLSLSASYIRFG